MKSTSLVIGIILFFTSVSDLKASNYNINNDIKVSAESGGGGNTSSTVNLRNNFGTNSNSYSSNGKTETNVEIHQEGEGTSEVTINGKTWKQDGPGDISVHESTGDNSDTNDENSPTITEKPEEGNDPEVLSAESEHQNLVQKVLSFFRNFLSKFFR